MDSNTCGVIVAGIIVGGIVIDNASEHWSKVRLARYLGRPTLDEPQEDPVESAQIEAEKRETI